MATAAAGRALCRILYYNIIILYSHTGVDGRLSVQLSGPVTFRRNISHTSDSGFSRGVGWWARVAKGTEVNTSRKSLNGRTKKKEKKQPNQTNEEIIKKSPLSVKVDTMCT